MLKVENKIKYKAFGFTILSEIPLQELYTLDNDIDSIIDIEIEKKELSHKWFSITTNNNGFLTNKNKLMYKFGDVAIFSIEDGSKISVSPLKEYDEDVARLLILGTCMGVILMQRKILPLHGSAIEIDGKAYTIIGESGAGKSTLAAAFLAEGYKLLTDDVIALSVTKENIPFITPSYPHQKLWEDSLLNFGLDKSKYNSLFGRQRKFSVPVTARYTTEEMPLGGIFELVKTDDGEIQLEEIKGLNGLQTICRNTYREFIIPTLGLADWHFQQSTNILNKVKMYKLGRPTSDFSAPQLVSKILKTIGDINDNR
jgi:hypothetical protein